MNTKTLEKNVKNAYGEQGLKWLSSLPLIIESLSARWSLTNIIPADNMNWNYVAYAIQNNNHVVLKISCLQEIIESEYRALKQFDGSGSIKLIDYHPIYHALLLEQAMPGNSLKENYPIDVDKIIIAYSRIVKSISSKKLLSHDYQHMSAWCDAIDKIQDSRIEKCWVDRAKLLKAKLLSSVENEYLCHGDLHLENIIQNHNEWLAIDPKGVIGEIAFEAAAFDLIDNNEFNDSSITIQTKIKQRVYQLATALEIDFNRLLSWIYVRIIISAQWFVEDKGDPSRMLKLAKYVYPLLENNFNNKKNHIEMQINQCLTLLHEIFKTDLLGVYLYGSSVLGGMQKYSDLDLLVVINRATAYEEKVKIVKNLLKISGIYMKSSKRSIEMTIVNQVEVNPWRYPPNFDFQYGEWLRNEFKRGNIEPWITKEMPDLALLITKVLLTGKTLVGAHQNQLLCPVPYQDIITANLDSLPSLMSELNSDTRNVLLTLARIWCMVETNTERSKTSAATWTIDHLPENYRPVMKKAKAIYKGETEENWQDVEELIKPCADFMINKINDRIAKIMSSDSADKFIKLAE